MPPSHSPDNYAQAVLETLLAPWRTLRRFWKDIVTADDRLSHDETLTGRLVSLITLPWRLLVGVFTFILFAWSTTRSGVAFVRGFPAIAIMAGFFAALLAADLIYNEARMISTNTGYYRFHTERSPDNPEWAEMFARKLMEIKPADPEPKYMLALSLEKADKLEEAEDLMGVLAPEDQPGYGPAHLWKARQIIASNEQQLDEQSFESAKRHLEMATAAGQRLDEEIDLSPKFTLALLYRNQAMLPDSTEQQKIHFLELADQEFDSILTAADSNDAMLFRIRSLQPAANVKLELARLQPEKYDSNRVKAVFDRQIDELMRLAKRRAPDAMLLWQTMVSCAIELDDAEKAVDIINTGMKAATAKETRADLAALASEAFVVEARKIKDLDSKANYEQRLALLCRSLKFNPQQGKAYAMLLEFIGEPQDSDSASQVPIEFDRLQEARMTNQVLIDSGALMSALAGMHKIAVGDFEGGIKSWRIGQQSDPRTGIFIRNLLDVAIQFHRSRFSNLQDMLGAAIQIYPNDYLFYSTRGSFHQQEGRYREAIEDYQLVIDKDDGRDKTLIRQQLKICYQRTGQQEKADEQQRKIDASLLEKTEEQRRRMQELLDRIAERDA